MLIRKIILKCENKKHQEAKGLNIHGENYVYKAFVLFGHFL